MLKALKNIGPGLIVTSAFIGPGTVTLCILSGIEYGYSLLWCIIFSIIATCYLQEISSRNGIISRKGLSEILVDIENVRIKNKWALVIGSAAHVVNQKLFIGHKLSIRSKNTIESLNVSVASGILLDYLMKN